MSYKACNQTQSTPKSGTGNAWPEQEIILAWMKRRGIELGFTARLELQEELTKSRLASHAEREGAAPFQCPHHMLACAQRQRCEYLDGKCIRPSPAASDGLVKFVESLAYKEEFIHQKSHDIVFAIAEAIRSRPADSGEVEPCPFCGRADGKPHDHY